MSLESDFPSSTRLLVLSRALDSGQQPCHVCRRRRAILPASGTFSPTPSLKRAAPLSRDVSGSFSPMNVIFCASSLRMLFSCSIMSACKEQGAGGQGEHHRQNGSEAASWQGPHALRAGTNRRKQSIIPASTDARGTER